MLATGKTSEMPVSTLLRMVAKEHRELQEWPVLAALPFSSDGPAQVLLPDSISRINEAECPDTAATAAPADVARTACSIEEPAHPYAYREQPTPEVYCANVAAALHAIREGRLEKVVLARSLKVKTQIAAADLLRRLAGRNPSAYSFSIRLAESPAGARYLIGASPELLLSKRGRQIASHPLAGSIARSPDPAEDGRRARALLLSAKDRYEHSLVVNAVTTALIPFCTQMHVPAEPTLLATPTMWHLGTEIMGVLKEASTSSLTLAQALHPTPAVCGFPQNVAYDFIHDCEGFERDLFAGLVGWCDANGDGEWAVTIRCAELAVGSATLYAGAGIVHGSSPESELAETSAKLRTMLNAMGLEPLPEAT
ncbi:isochorismate synthase [Herbaspirillum lusitanum]|uniref:isochorismate synthase n=1 Tax=Herbaspirillum lusitanum TaxID=213312 RepID=A0ABW9ACD2_9BURK